MRILTHILLGLVLWCSRAYGVEAEVRASVEFMAGLGSRVAGYPGAAAAADHVEEQFRRMGLERVRREAFDVVVPMDRGGKVHLVEAGETFPIWSMWPNLVRTSTLPPEGLEAGMIYGGEGELADFDGMELQGRVALLEFNSGSRWLQAASLGVAAIVFVEPQNTSWQQAGSKFVDAPLDVPRFWVEREAGDFLRRYLADGERRVRLEARMEWDRRPAWNILGEIRGQDQRLASETVVLQAYYDGPSVVPGLAPAAEMSSSIAALLEVARHLRQHPPARSVLLLATGAHFQARQGMVDFVARHARRHAYYAPHLPEPLGIDLFIGLDLSSQSDQLGVWNNTSSFKLKRHFVPFGRRFTDYAAQVAPALGVDPQRALVNGISPLRGMDWSTYVPGGMLSSGEVAMRAGRVALTLATVHDGRFNVDTPLDRPAFVRFDNLARQVELLQQVLVLACDDAQLLEGTEELEKALKDELRDLKVLVRTFPRRSSAPDRPVQDAVVVIDQERRASKGMRGKRFYLADADGEVQVPALSLGSYPLTAYLLDEESGAVVYAPDLSLRAAGSHGKPVPNGFLGVNIRWKKHDKTLVLFPAVGRPFYSLVDPRFLNVLRDFKVFDGRGGNPEQYGYSLATDARSAAGVLFGPHGSGPAARLKVMLGGRRILLLNSAGFATEDEAKGRGFLLSEDDLARTDLQAARDMWNLDEVRIQTMRRHAIENKRLVRLHRRGGQLLVEAEEAAEQKDWTRYVARVRAALGVEARAYPDVLDTLNDVLDGLVFFLALVIPAAFFGERLLFAASDIRRQLAYFGLILLTIWLLISQVHPAFEIAQPLVILLAFAIMSLAVFVLVLLSGRCSRFVDAYRNSLAAVHEADISRLSASYTAFMLGISNMRRRRLRTGLTLLTLVLLTFTMLSFTSFEQQMRFVAYSQDRDAAYEGVLLRHPGWGPLEANALDYARSHFGRAATVSPRNWHVDTSREEKSYVVVRRGQRRARALGLLGLGPQEQRISGIGAAVEQGRFFERPDELSCLLPQRMAEELGLEKEDVGRAKVQIFGRELLVCGLIDAGLMAQIRDLDGETLMPADFQMSAFQEAGVAAGPEEPYGGSGTADEIRSFVHLEPDNVLIVPYQILEEAGGSLRSVAVRFDAAADGQTLIEEFLVRVAATLFAGLRQIDGTIRVYAYSSMGMTAVEGMGALVIPALIAALIMLNAMLGAVYERLREIGIYSSVGLAPLHISLLFVAEACVFAVLGVTLGYLLGQGLGKVLISVDWLTGVNLNYSSMAAVVSSLLVMVVVLISTAYPARMAARTAVTDTVLRRWQPPPPEGDTWAFSFPFRVPESEVRGMCGFLYNYFNSFREGGGGAMATDRVGLQQVDGQYAVLLRAWLPPFDLGVSQDMQLIFAPTEIPGSHSIEIQLQRISGEQVNWQRLNRLFMNRLRKQMLIWHTLVEAERERHRETAVEVLEATLAAVEVEEVAETEEAATGKSPFTWKGLLVGALGSLCIGIGAPYSIIVLKGSWMALNSSSPAAVFLFFLLAFFVNTALSLIRRRFALSRADLVLVYVMLLMAVAVPNQAFVGYLIPVISGLYYYATPENKWAELFFPHVESWLAPESMKAMVDLHEGLKPGEAIPWGVWVEPLGYWYVFFLVLSFMMICMSSILHRQWSTHERLAYPMVELPLQIIEEGKGPLEHVRPFFKNWVMWAGFAVPAVLLGMTGLNHYVPSVPEFNPNFGSLQFFEKRVSLPMAIRFPWVGFFYLVNLDISAGVWVFFVLGKIQEGIFRTLGVASTEQLSLYSYSQMADLTHQSMGACLAFVVYILWLARHHLRDVWRKAWSGAEDVDDSEELLPYRVAVFGFLGSLFFVGAWLWASGVPLVILPLFLSTCLVFYIMVTRVVAAAGVATARSPMVAAFFVISGVGTSIIGSKGLVALTMTYIWQSEMRLFPMIACANGLKLAEVIKGPKRRLFWGMVIALLCSLAGATWIILTVFYENGGINLHPFFMRHQPMRTFTDMARPLTHPTGPDLRGWIFTGVGAAIEALLVFAQYRLHWWPLHPIGFIIGVGWLTSQIWFSVLVAWLLKLAILKYGGVRAFNAAKPFFLGLIMGEATLAGFWLVVDWLAGESGNFISFN